MPAQPPKASPEAAPTLQLVLCDMCSMWGVKPPNLPAAAQPWVQLKPDTALCMHTVVFLPLIYEVQLKEPQMIFTNF